MAQSSRFPVPPSPRRRGQSPRSTRSPVVRVERLWGRLTDFFRNRTPHSLATQAVLAPRRLEPRRMLDAAAAGLLLETLDYSADYVQTASDPASLTPASNDNAAAITTPAGSIEIAPTSPIDENGIATLEFIYDVPGAHAVQIDWGDGQVESFTIAEDSQLFSTTHQYLDDNPTLTSQDDYDITVSVIGSLGTVTDVTTQTVFNVAPSNVQLDLVSPKFEGDVTDLTVTFDDPGTLDTHTVEVNWGDGVIENFQLDGSRFLFTTHQYLDDPPSGTTDGSYTATVRVLDDDGGQSPEASATIAMQNVAPSNVQVSMTSPIFENGFTELTMTFDDPGVLDTHTVEVDWGDGVIENFTLTGDRFFSTTHQYLDDPPSGTTDGSYTATVRVIDDDTGEATGSATVTMLNVAPSNVQVSLVSPIFENGFTELTMTFDDPGTLDTHTVEVDWGDGVIETFNLSGERVFNTTHQYLDDPPTGTIDGSYTATVRVIDDDTGEASGSATVTVLNVAPSNVQVSLVSPIFENGFTELTMTFDDPGTLDTHTVEVDWGDGVIETFTLTGDRFFSTTHQYLDDPPSGTTDGSYTATVRVIDDDLGEAMGTATVTMLNVAPSNVQVSLVSPIFENDFTELTVTFDDPGTLDTHALEVNWGDGVIETFNLSGDRFFSTTHQYLDDPPSGTPDGVYTVIVTITDDDTGVGQGMADITILNVAPRDLVVIGPAGSVNEGSQTSISVAFDDPGTLDTYTYVVYWGDGKSSTGSVGVGGRAFDETHIYADNGTYTVLVEITDDDTGLGTGGTGIGVINVAPTAVQPGPLSVDEGSPLVLSGNTRLVFTDPGFDNPLNTQDPSNGGETVETFTYIIDWDDGTAMTPGMADIDVPGGENVLTQGSISSQHIYADNGEYEVTVTIVDDDLGETVLTFIVNVDNVAPTLTPPGVQPVFQINEGQTVTIPDFGTFTDPAFNNPLNTGNPANGGEVAETFSYTVDWGDGTVETFTPTSTNGGENVLTAGSLGGASHFYADNPDGGNVYQVVVTLSDDDEGTAQRIIDVTVLNVAPTLSPLTATDVNPQGFTTLNLFFTDPGADQYRVLVDWGDNLNVANPQERFEIIDIQPIPDGAGGHSYTITHQYLGPPNPLNPAADITISVKIWDDELVASSLNVPEAVQPVTDPGESNVEIVVIGNFGTGSNDPVFIDTTPQVPMLTISERPADTVVVVDANTSVAVTTAGEISGAGGESVVTGERYLELKVINPDGTESEEGVPLSDRWLNNLPGLFRKLPDNHYAIYLVQAETDVRRLVIDVFVRNGKLIDPGDDSEGARDRPPTDEASNASSTEALKEALGDDQSVGEENLPPQSSLNHAEPWMPTLSAPGASSVANVNFEARTARSGAALRYGRALAGVAVGLAAANTSWRRQVDKALAEAKPGRWKRLRTAGYWRRRRPRH